MPTKNKLKVSKSLFLVCAFLMSIAATAMTTLITFNTDADYRRYYTQLVAGQIADESIFVRSDIDVIDVDATNKLKEDAASSVLPVFSYSQKETLEMITSFDELRSAYLSGNHDKVEEILGTSVALSLENMHNKSMLAIMYEILVHICNTGYYRADEIAKIQLDGFNSFTLFNRYNAMDETETVVDLSSFIITDFNITSYIVSILNLYDNDITIQDIHYIRDVLTAFLKPNVHYDNLLYEERKATAVESVLPVILSFKRGDVILERDHVVTQDQLRQLRLLSNQSHLSIEEIALDFVFTVFVIALLLYLFVNRTKGDKNRITIYISLLTFFVIVTFAATYFHTKYAINVFNATYLEAFLPVIFVPVLMTVVSGQRFPGIISSLIISVCMMLVPNMTVMTFFYSLFCGVACVYLVRFFTRRVDTFFQWTSSILAVSVLDVFFILREYGFYDIQLSLLASAVCVTVAFLLISTLLPILEKVFNLPTTFRLNELSYIDSSLLTRLAKAAPGTYSHSQNVAELARSAATAINANPMIAYIGGLYHDIGKTEHPEYFVENQAEENKHDEINPHLSASIIRNHVKAGAQRGREARLPSEIVDIIENHHGNDVIAYFYNEAKKLQPLTGHENEVDSSDFRYQANIPSSKECAIVMIVDSIEAAARTVVSPTPAKFSKLIHQIVLSKIEKGLLNNSHLTMKDIETIEAAVLKTLSAQYHNRIEYPDEDKKGL